MPLFFMHFKKSLLYKEFNVFYIKKCNVYMFKKMNINYVEVYKKCG